MGRLLLNSSNKALVNALGKAYAVDADEVAGTLPMTLEAAPGGVLRLMRYGKCEQNGTPTPSIPVDIVCNNGAVGEAAHSNPEALRVYGELYTDEGKTEGIYIDDNGVIQPITTAFTTDFIPLSPSTPYKLAWTRTTSGVYTRVHLYDSSKNWLAMAYKESDLYNGDKTATFSTTPQTAYVRISFQKATTNISLVNDLAASVPDLLKVQDIYDEADIIGGKVTRRVGIWVLDGTEQVNYFYASNQYDLFRVYVPTEFEIPTSKVGIFCTHFVGATSMGREDGTISGSTIGRIDFIKNGLTTAQQWSDWVAQQYANGTPVIVILPLTEEATEWVTPQELQTGAGSNTVSSTYADAQADITYKV